LETNTSIINPVTKLLSKIFAPFKVVVKIQSTNGIGVGIVLVTTRVNML